MQFKSLKINTEQVLAYRDIPFIDDPIINIIVEHQLISNRYAVFKLKKYKSPSPFGYETETDVIPLSEYIADGKIVDIKFYVIDCISKKAFYDGVIDDIKRLLKVYFDIKRSRFDSEIDLNDLKSLSSIKIVNKEAGEISLFQDGVFETSPEIYELAEDCQVKETTREVKFITFEGIKPRSLESFIHKNNTGLNRIYMTGEDKNGNQLISDSEGKFSKKIDIFTNITKWEEKKELSLEVLLNEIISKS